jgi:hypothetical protein
VEKTSPESCARLSGIPRACGGGLLPKLMLKPRTPCANTGMCVASPSKSMTLRRFMNALPQNGVDNLHCTPNESKLSEWNVVAGVARATYRSITSWRNPRREACRAKGFALGFMLSARGPRLSTLRKGAGTIPTCIKITRNHFPHFGHRHSGCGTGGGAFGFPRIAMASSSFRHAICHRPDGDVGKRNIGAVQGGRSQ